MTAVCIIPNCNRSCPPAEPFCSAHRDGPMEANAMTNFEYELDELVAKWAPKTSTDDLISALELMIMHLKEDAEE